MNRDIILLLFILMLLFQCTERKRANPLDPQNPDTDGKLVGLRIYSEFDTITLTWQGITVEGLMGYNIYRKISGDASFSLIHLSSADSNIFYDRHVVYDLRHTYKISVLTSTYESPLSDSISIVPGPTVIWITDADNRYLIKISHDGLHEIGRISVDGYPWDIAIDPQDRSIWYSDVFWGSIYHIRNEVWKIYVSSTSWWEPVDFDFDDQREIIWVADQRGKIIRISPTAIDSVREISDENFSTPFSVAVIKRTGDCCVADPIAKSVFYISTDGNIITKSAVTFSRPSVIVTNQLDASCWVADYDRIIKLLPEDSSSQEINDDLNEVYTLDVDQDTGELWVIDYDIDYRLIKFDGQGNKLLQVTGFNNPQALAVNPYDHGCVIVDTGNGKVVRVSSQGAILSEIGHYYYPRGIAIEYLK